MVNLIPPSAKKGVVIEYWIRVLTIWSIITTLVTILFAVSFLPVQVHVDSKIDAYQESANEATEKIASFESVSRDLNQSTKQAQLLIANTKQISLSSTIELLSSLESGGIEIRSIDVSRDVGDKLLPITITGGARDRQALADFRDRLLAEEKVESVDLPISNLAKDSDINFTITITMSNQPVL